MLTSGKIQILRRLYFLVAVVVALWLVGCAKPDLDYSPAKGDNRSVPPIDRTATQLYQYYDDWRHVRYRYGGLSKKGIDCSGLVFNAYHTLFNIELPRTVASQIRSGYRVSRKRLTAGDLVFFKTGFRQRHVGIYIANNQFMHVTEKKGVTITDLNHAYWGKRYWMAIRVQT